jgi:tetratricopeptide (TPR) repeat protein
VEAQVPRRAVEFLLASGARTQLFHGLGDGSYLIWAAAGRYPVFVDGRLEVYGEALLARYLELCERRWESVEAWNRVADAHGFHTLMLHRASHGPLLALLRRAPDWPLVYLDGRNVIFVRDTPQHAALVRAHRIDLDRPWGPSPAPADEAVASETAKTLLVLESPANAARWLEAGLARSPEDTGMRWALALIHRSVGHEERAAQLLRGLHVGPVEAARGERQLAELRRMQGLQAVPTEAAHWQNLGVALERIDDRQGAIEAYRKAVAADPGLYRVHNQLGILLAQSGERAAARRCFVQALTLEPDYESARMNLTRLGDPD